jgi:arsenate reductase-like glutaredoxin family protein
LLEEGADLEFRDIGKDRFSAEELDALIGERDYKLFLNTRNELYRERNMREHPPSRAEAIKMMVAEPNLIRRPIVIRGREMLLGWDEEALKKFVR